MGWEQSLQIAQAIVTIAVALYSVISARRSASAADARELGARLTRQDERLLMLEQQVVHLPDHKLVAEMLADMRGMRAELQGMAQQLAPLARSVDRINDYLLSRNA